MEQLHPWRKLVVSLATLEIGFALALHTLDQQLLKQSREDTEIVLVRLTPKSRC
jgi:hypothetical protein